MANDDENKVTQEANQVSGDLAGRDVNKPTYNIGKINIGGHTQLEKLYKKLEKEKEESTTFCEIVEELLHFKNHADGREFIGLEKKLANAERSNYLRFAESVKEKFVKKLLRNEHSETAQLIYAFLLAKVYSNFQIHVYPKILDGHPQDYINHLIDECILKPIEDLLGENLLRIFTDEVNGMIYFLTGNCHIKWN